VPLYLPATQRMIPAADRGRAAGWLHQPVERDWTRQIFREPDNLASIYLPAMRLTVFVVGRARVA